MKKYIYYIIMLLLFTACSSKNTVPIYDYYKNIPIIRGWTTDEEQRNFMIEVVLVYRENNGDLKTRINLLKPSLIDALRGYFSSFKEEDYVIENQDNLKLNAVNLLNEVILDSMIPKNAEKLRKNKTLEDLDLLLDIDIMQLQLFKLN